MGHDLGHTPFGHAGEKVLAKLMPDGFHHVKQSLRVVEKLERDGQGLNLTRRGARRHPQALEGQGAHHLGQPEPDGDDAGGADRPHQRHRRLREPRPRRRRPRPGRRSGERAARDPATCSGDTHGERIARMVDDMVSASRLEEKRQIRMTDEVLDALIALRDFLYETRLRAPEIRGEFEKAQRIISELWGYFHAHADEFRAKHWPKGIPESDGLSRAVADFITGMTDRYALRVYEEYFLPRRWPVY